MTLLDRFFVHTVMVETNLGTGPYGDTFAAPTAVRCFVDDAQDVVVTGTTVAVNDQTKIYAPPTAAPSTPPVAGQFAVNSRVTVNGQVTLVHNVKRRSSGALHLPDHVEVSVR